MTAGKRDLAALALLASGGSVTARQFNHLCDLGLAGYEKVMTVRVRHVRIPKERFWVTEAGRSALKHGGGDA